MCTSSHIYVAFLEKMDCSTVMSFGNSDVPLKFILDLQMTITMSFGEILAAI